MQDARLPCLNLVLQGHQGSIRGPLTFLIHLIRPQMPLSCFEVDEQADLDHRRFTWFRCIEEGLQAGQRTV